MARCYIALDAFDKAIEACDYALVSDENYHEPLLIKAQAVITKKVLKEIEKFGKLRELMLYSK